MPERPDSYERMPFLKLFSREWLHGSLRVDNDAAERGVWADFMAAANESRQRGVIQANDDTPYPHSYLAAMLNIPLELLEHCIQKFTEQGRIRENKHGIVLTSFDYWQNLNTRRGRGRPRKLPLPTEEQRLENEYRTRIGVAYREKKSKLGRALTPKEEQTLQSRIHKEVYGDENRG